MRPHHLPSVPAQVQAFANRLLRKKIMFILGKEFLSIAFMGTAEFD